MKYKKKKKEVKEEPVKQEEKQEPEVKKVEEKVIPEIKEEKKPILESSKKEEFTLSGNKDIPTQQTNVISPEVNIQKEKPKEEPKEEIPKKEEIIKEEKVNKEEKEKNEERRNDSVPFQPYLTYMMMYPSIPPSGNDNKKDNKPPMVFMIPVYCADPRSFPNDFPMSPMPPMQPMPMPIPNMQFPFYGYSPFPMNMQHK